MNKKDTKDITLHEFQRWMQARLVEPQHNADHSTEHYEVADIINGSDQLSAEAHLAIYQRGYIARLRDCMAKQFSTLAHALGEELFQAFADDYLIVHPSHHYNLSKLGEKFASYLEDNRPDKDQAVKEDWPDFLIELADFEYHINRIFDQKSDGNFSPATDNTKDGELALVPTFRLFAFNFPIRPYYSDVTKGHSPILPFPQKTYCAVLRRQDNFRLNLFDLIENQYQLLECISQGQSISSYISEHNLTEPWKQWRTNWIDNGFFMRTK